MRTEIASGVVHDFRNILAVIGSAVRMAEMSLDRPEHARIYLTGAQEGIDRGLKLTSELLTFATPREPREVGEAGTELYDVNLLLTKLEPLLNYGAGPGVRVELELAPDIPKCVVDPPGFEMAILNLIVNARDAMAGVGEIRVGTQRCSEPSTPLGGSRRSVRVRVEDNGQGMTPDVVQKIFDPFFTTKGSRGTGLGLPQVHKFMRQLGGHTRVASEQGIGTVIDLFFPLIGPGDRPSLVRRAVELGDVVGQ
jgi:signal transduction histidine kinase